MNNIIFASFCALFAFSCLTGCGGGEKKAATTDKAIPTPEELKERYKDVKLKPISLGE